MKSILVIFVFFLSFGYAQQGGANRGGTVVKPPDKQPEKQQEKQPEKQPDKQPDKQPEKALVRRLEAVTWNPVRAELTWMVSVWNFQSGERSLVAKERYTMHPDDAVMESDGEFRKFDSAEAKRLRILMDVISTYAVESTVWWDYGPDAKVETQVIPMPDDDAGAKGNANRDKTDKDADKDPDKDEKPKPAPKPAPTPNAPKALVGPKAEPGA